MHTHLKTIAMTGLLVTGLSITSPLSAHAASSEQTNLAAPNSYTVSDGSIATIARVKQIRIEDAQDNSSTVFMIDTKAATTEPKIYQNMVRKFTSALAVEPTPAQVLIDIVPNQTHLFPLEQRENRLVDSRFALELLSTRVVTGPGSDSRPANQVGIIDGTPYAVSPKINAKELMAAGWRNTPNQGKHSQTSLDFINLPPEQGVAAQDYIQATIAQFDRL